MKSPRIFGVWTVGPACTAYITLSSTSTGASTGEVPRSVVGAQAAKVLAANSLMKDGERVDAFCGQNPDGTPIGSLTATTTTATATATATG